MKRRSVSLLSAVPLALIVSGCLTRGMDIPAGTRIMAEFYIGYGILTSGLFPSSPEAPEGLEGSLHRELGETTAVGLALDERGDLYVAASDRQRKGVSDNRMKPYWLLDDLAAEHVNDRRRYIEKWAERGKDPLSWYTEHADKVLRVRDVDGDGSAETLQEVAAFNDVTGGIGASVLAHDGDVYFTDIPDLWRLRELGEDGVARERERMAHGFGVATSLGGHDLHGLTWGPDGRIYFSVGDRGYNVVTGEGVRLRPPMVVSRGAVFRMQPDGSELEVFATGLRNPQDLVFDDYGNLFTGDNNADGVDEARLVYVMEGSDSGWAMPAQTIEGPYLHGPWEAERLWETQHAGQPAWVLPPIGYIARGPAGAAMDPGLGGLPAELRGKILVCDYQYTASRSGIRAYGVESAGAGFALADSTTAFGSVLATDLDFGPDGRVYLLEFSQFQGASRIHRFENAAHLADPRVEELRRLLREGFEGRSAEELAQLLGHADRRARRGAQHALVVRRDGATLARVARDEDAPLLARVHALWGLGQLGSSALRAAGIDDLEWSRRADPELRAQTFAMAGEASARWLIPELVEGLDPTETPRARAMAATALGKLRAREAIGALVALARDNGDRDVYLRHSVVHALERIEDVDEVLAHADDPAPSVRRVVLLVLRRREDARVARFLRDPDPELVVEAARAIHDLHLLEAFPALAALGSAEGAGLPLRDDDPQTSYALHRRVIGANLALGTEEAANALAAHAADPRNPEAMRIEALESLAQFTRPEPRERVFGFYRGWPERPDATVHAALDTLVPALVGTSLEARALEVALAYGRVPLPDDELLARVEGWFVSETVQRASLRALAERRSPLAGRAVASALGSRRAGLRAEARDVLAALDPGRAIEEIRELSPRAPVVERQRAYGTLATIGSDAADAELRTALARLRGGELDPSIELDVLEAARRREASLHAELAAYDASLPAGDLLAPRRVALEGGDAVRGRRVFEGAGDCRRCHSTRRGEGARAGPSLRRVGSRRSRAELIESIVLPQAEISPGFGTVRIELEHGEGLVGTLVEEDDESVTVESRGDRRRVSRAEIASASTPVSGMPPLGLALPLWELRDLIEYLSTL